MRNFLSVDPMYLLLTSRFRRKQKMQYVKPCFRNLSHIPRSNSQSQESKQDFCYVSRFPPVHAIITVEAVSMQSCQDACRQHNFLCERSFFRIVNMPEFLNKSGSCATLNSIPIPYAPYECSKQENSDLYSCASVPTILDIRRICPCRDFLQGQTALFLLVYDSHS